jgi:hypothetical protein
MYFSKTLRSCEVACLLSLLVAPVHAQVNRNGAVAGVITGPDGSSVPASTISLTSVDGQVRIGSATQDGTFTLSDLASGSYVVRVTASGFATYTDASVSVAVGRTTHLIVKLALAGAQESVSVNGRQTAFDTTQTSSVVNIDRDRVEEAPIPNRNYLDLYRRSFFLSGRLTVVSGIRANRLYGPARRWASGE